MKRGAIALLLAALPVITAKADPPGNIDIDPALHAWFERQHNLRGGWCCNLGDGHIIEDTEWKTSESGYQVLIAGKWYKVDSDTLRRSDGDPNPTGKAIVWYRGYGNRDGDFAWVTIYCFAPGTEY